MRNLSLVFLLACGGTPKSTTPPVEAAKESAVAVSVAAAMNPEVNPCDDFYEYACGGWIKTTELPEDRPIITRSFTTIFDENQAMIHGILESASKDPGDDPVKQKLGAYYGACMDVAAIDARGTAPIQPWIDEINSADTLPKIFEVAAKITQFGPNPFFGSGVWADDKNPSLNILQISQDGLGLPDRDYYLDLDDAGKERVEKYRTTIKEMLTLAGDDPERASAAADNVVAFEEKLAEVMWERAALRDSEKTYNKFTVEELQAKAPNVPFAEYFEALGIHGATSLNVRTPSYFEGMSALVADTDVSVLQDYLRWNLVSWAAPHLSTELVERNFAFFGKELSGTPKMQPRWKRCVNRTDGAMGEWLGKAYVDAKFAGDSKAIAEEMVAGIFAAFEKNLPNLDWMDDKTRERAKEKSQAFVAKLGYPNKYRDYSDLAVSSDTYLENTIAAGQFGMAYNASKVDKPVDKDEWHMTPQTVNAYYNPPANEIVFPAGIMQPPFFSKDFPRAMNFGALGMVIGHEITHGFDDEGRKYAPTGELKEWWEPEVVERFEERAECVVDLYNGFEVQPGLNVNGELTLGENIADIGGLKIAHLAYLEWVAQHGEEPKLAGLTGEQQVYVAFAQGWCSKATDQIAERRVKTDPHSPPEFRINGAAMTNPGFAEAFECPVGSPMNPKDRCVVW